MHLQPMSVGELLFRNPYEPPEDFRCAACEQRIPKGPVWTVDDHDLTPADQMLCNAFYFCASCVTDEATIRQTILDTAAEYDGTADSHAEALRRMAESPLTQAAAGGK
jgi:hypothetical protein